MTTHLNRLGLLGLSLLTACTQAPAPDAQGETQAATQPAAATAADTAAINALREQEVAALTSGDTTLAYMDTNVVLMPAGEPAVVGVPAARTWAAGFLRQFRASISYDKPTVTFAGDLAVEQYAGTLTLTPVAGGQPMTEKVKGLHVYRRGPGGWKMIYDVWNSDSPPHEPPPQR